MIDEQKNKLNIRLNHVEFSILICYDLLKSNVSKRRDNFRAIFLVR